MGNPLSQATDTLALETTLPINNTTFIDKYFAGPVRMRELSGTTWIPADLTSLNSNSVAFSAQDMCRN